MKLGLNQIDFAALGSVTKSAQVNYEKGERSPDAEYLIALTGHGVDAHYLLTGVPAEKAASGLSADDAEALALFGLLDADDRVVALRVLKALTGPAA